MGVNSKFLKRCFIIAEVSTNHGQNFDWAVTLIKKAKASVGSAVVLTKGVLGISIAKFVKQLFNNEFYFDRINNLIIMGLKKGKVKNLTKKGIFDICIGDKKILGSSIYRRNKLLFYQSSSLTNLGLNIIAKYLKYPSREPDYRNGRAHEHFLTSLQKESYGLSIKEVKGLVGNVFNDYPRTVN